MAKKKAFVLLILNEFVVMQYDLRQYALPGSTHTVVVVIVPSDSNTSSIDGTIIWRNSTKISWQRVY